MCSLGPHLDALAARGCAEFKRGIFAAYKCLEN